ncbi:pilus assembly protein [Tsuneonella sp. YG55]|uniref:Pilus assembly protein n=1 Tax=Tsuneonella litorea TaxID=2976475 RepID=A0A9X2W0P3_9SPHN|nr:TadE family protein [Tsuneonella litorea]MCT2558666.1 pilus assembly protein [Tsuneonella litorea]
MEFALISPALLLLLLGMFEMGYNYYLQAQLQGAVQKAARDSTTQAAVGSMGAIDARVTAAVRTIVPDATLTFSRRAYSSFSDVHRAEDFTDLDNNGICSNGEPFEDANGNGIWDDDRGVGGGGGARDAVLYVVEVRYPRAFGAAQMVGLPDTVTTQATTVLRNQPWEGQAVIAGVGNCT